MATMRDWHHSSAMCPPGMDARRHDGRHAAQVAMIVRAPSKAAAMRYLNATGAAITRGYFDDYWDEGWPGAAPILDQYPPGTVLVGPMDPGDTINGGTDWVVVPCRDDV